MNVKVIGLGFGDEGKGLFTDYLATKIKDGLIVRFSGGHQVGHMVNTGGIRHVFSNFGSGTLRGVPTYWSKECTVDPVGLTKELSELKSKGVKPTILIDSLCPITTPFDKEANLKWDIEKKHGTVGVGFGKTIEREENFYSLKFIDILYPEIFIEKLSNIEKYYGSLPVDVTEFFSAVKEVRTLLHNNENIYIVLNEKERDNLLHSGKYNLIYEGSQGLMLDPKLGFFPHVTRSNLIPPVHKKTWETFYFITRAYGTRHGNGYLPNENEPFDIKVNPNEINTDYGIQGKFRRAMLDVSLLKYSYSRYLATQRTEELSTNVLVITCLDHLKNFKFTFEGEVFEFDTKEKFCEAISNMVGIISYYMVDGDTVNNVYRAR